MLNLDGAFTVLPDNTWESRLSPDFRYTLREFDVSHAGGWMRMNIVIAEVASGRVVHTASTRHPDTASPRPQWQWTADGRHFAWSTGDGFNFRTGRIAEGGDDGEVWLLNVETGATERLTARAYAERRSPAASPAVEFPDFDASCPGDADPIQFCAVLLDGVAVGEGRWAEAIGFVALD